MYTNAHKHTHTHTYTHAHIHILVYTLDVGVETNLGLMAHFVYASELDARNNILPRGSALPHTPRVILKFECEGTARQNHLIFSMVTN